MNYTRLPKRETNFDLLKIIAMIMIIVLHFNLYGISYKSLDTTSSIFGFANIMEYLCIGAVDLYVMITGYFMITSRRKLKKILELEFKIIIYSTFIYLFLVGIHKIKFDAVPFIKLFFPLTTNTYWFMSAYLGLYILIPFINRLVNLMTKKEYLNLLMILTVFMVILKSFFPTNFVYENASGYSLIWFIYLYLLAGYLRLYFQKKIPKSFLFLIIPCIIAIQLVAKISLLKIKNINVWNQIVNNQLAYNSVLVLILSVIIFVMFRNIKIEGKIKNKIIQKISSLTIGVYLFHEHPYFRDILWNEILQPSKYIGTYKFYLAFWADILLIFIVGCLIEFIYQFLIKIIKKTKLFGIIEKKIDLKIKKLFEGEQL